MIIHDDIREPLIIINLSLPRRRESSNVKSFWFPAFAGTGSGFLLEFIPLKNGAGMTAFAMINVAVYST
jgi:hypothetical protein